MKSSFYKSWWREMGAISRGMMFIEGNVATPASLERTAPSARRAPATSGDPHSISVGLRKKADRLYRDFLLLGGRPVTPGHNDDINEPFPQLDEDEPAPAIRSLVASARQGHAIANLRDLLNKRQTAMQECMESTP